jgi:aminocarboxymuconate-semialdehyde decarboxylase
MAGPSLRDGTVLTGGATMTVVDVHAHAVPASFLEDLAARRIRFPHVDVRRTDAGYTVAFGDEPPTRPVAVGLVDLGRRAAWLAARGVDRQVISGWLDLFGYSLPGDEGADWAAALTQGLYELAECERAGGDGWLIPLGTVPLQDPRAAADALTALCARPRAADARPPGSRPSGSRPHAPGVMIATRAGARELDDPALRPFWAAADQAGAVVYLHPGFGRSSPRYADFGLLNGLARIEDSTVTVARLLYAGVPARFPGMKLVVAHGGGALPYVLGRLVRNHLVSPGTADPLESFAQLYFDSVVFDPAALAFLAAKAGASRVLLGSDYPFGIGDPEPRRVVDHAALSPAERAAILSQTASRLFGGP